MIWEKPSMGTWYDGELMALRKTVPFRQDSPLRKLSGSPKEP